MKGSLLYTKEGDLDFGWIILIACCVVGLGVFLLTSVGAIKGPPVAAWAWFGSFTAMTFIAGAAIGRARLIAQSRVPGDVAAGIAQAGREYGISTEAFDTDE